MKNIMVIFILAVMLTAGLVKESMSGSAYHGHSMGMRSMSEMDSDNDGTITFDEFSAPHTESLKSAFKMLDADGDEEINEEEWNEFLKMHGVEENYEG